MIDDNNVPEQPIKTTSDELITSGENISYWIHSTKPLIFEEVNENLKFDAVVVGGGISGMTTAYLLSKNKKKVAVVEDGFIGSGETGRTTAHLVNALDDRYYELENYFGTEGAKLAADSHTAAINVIEETIKDENIDCEFTRLDGYLFLHPTDDLKSLNEELQATRRADIQTELVDKIPGILFERGPAIKFPNQATFHPLKYLKGLCDCILKNGGRIFTQTHVAKFESSGIITETGFRIDADYIVVATNTPVNDDFVIHTKQAPYRTYVIGALVPKGVLPNCLWWDTGDHNIKLTNYPYHYVRLQKYDDQYDLLISGGEDHKSGQPDEDGIDEHNRFQFLEEWTRERFPITEVKFRWSGQVMEPVDSLAFIGKNPVDSENIFIATGDSGNGMTHGTIAGMIITSLILEGKSKWAELYDPSRKTLKAAGDYIKEQLNVIKQYASYLTAGDLESVNELPPGSGAILREGLTKAAVFKDENGELYAYSAVCPHLQCIIEWNVTEKSFDCPCHGSRFTCYGKVINGPANRDLEEVGIPKN